MCTFGNYNLYKFIFIQYNVNLEKLQQYKYNLL